MWQFSELCVWLSSHKKKVHNTWGASLCTPMFVNAKTAIHTLAFPAIRSVCVPYSLRPFANHCLVFILFFFLLLVPLTRLYIWSSFSFSPRCYVTINLPPGTWRPVAPRRIWRTFCEQSHSLPRFFLSLPHNKTGICILIPLWPAEWDRVPAFCLFPVIVCKGGLAPNLPKQ